MFLRKFENNEEKDEFLNRAIKEHFAPLENFIKKT